MTINEKKKYMVKDSSCYKKKCFLPYSGNGEKICRYYELGICEKMEKGK